MLISRILLFGCLALLIGCAGSPQTRGDSTATEPVSQAESAPSTDVDWEPGIYELATGKKIDRETFYTRLAEAKYVVVGESHPVVPDHAEQDRIYRAMLERHKGMVALGLEMVSRPYQDQLDAFVAGAVGEEELLELLEWETRWGYPAYLYTPMFREARRASAPIVALNARRELTRAVSKEGVDGLPPEMAQDLVDLDLSNDAHREWMRAIFESHGMAMEPAKFEKFYQAQVVWDETMADSAYRLLAARPDLSAIVILAGRGHTERNWGIPSRIRRRDPSALVITVSPMQSPAPPLQTLQSHQTADYLVFL